MRLRQRIFCLEFIFLALFLVLLASTVWGAPGAGQTAVLDRGCDLTETVRAQRLRQLDSQIESAEQQVSSTVAWKRLIDDSLKQTRDSYKLAP